MLRGLYTLTMLKRSLNVVNARSSKKQSYAGNDAVDVDYKIVDEN